LKQPKIVVIIPAFNEENGIGNVIAEIPADVVAEVVVVNNNSRDRTSAVARQAAPRYSTSRGRATARPA
jgi:glycosyltransferase involved in cell wall biosynthesis